LSAFDPVQVYRLLRLKEYGLFRKNLNSEWDILGLQIISQFEKLTQNFGFND